MSANHQYPIDVTDMQWDILHIPTRLLLDSRVVDVLRSSTPTFAILSSLNPLFFNGIIDALHSRTGCEQKTLESNKSGRD